MQHQKKPLRVGLTLGDPGGIGPDLVLHALMHRHFRKRVKFTVFGSESILKKRIKFISIVDIIDKCLNEQNFKTANNLEEIFNRSQARICTRASC